MCAARTAYTRCVKIIQHRPINLLLGLVQPILNLAIRPTINAYTIWTTVASGVLDNKHDVGYIIIVLAINRCFFIER